MKKTIVGFVVAALVPASLILWALKGHLSGNPKEIGIAVIFLLCWLGVKTFGMKNA